MKFLLRQINIEKLIDYLTKKLKGKNQSIAIQYVDFNVLNYLYKKNLNHKEMKEIYLYPDSSALFFYIKFFIDHSFKKIVSTDLQNNFLVEINKIQSSICLFGDSDSILEKAVKNINSNYSKIKVVKIFSGYNFNTEKIILEINKNNIDVLFVGLGLGRQEKWILDNHKKINVKVILSVGGWFQYLAKNKKRAPLFLRKIHLEWMYKIIVEFPRVWKRYLIGVPIFIYRLLTKKIKLVIEKNENSVCK